MPRPKVLQGLRQSHPPADTPSPPVVIAKKSDPIYRSVRQPQFYLDGSLALAGRDPEIMCPGPLVKLRHPNGKESWVTVTPETYRKVVVGRVYPG